MTDNITYRTDYGLSLRAIHALFTRNDWKLYLSPEDVGHYLSRAIFVASASKGRQAIGLAVLCGDGRNMVDLDTLLVEKAYRGRGIGTELMKLVLAATERLKPWQFTISVFEAKAAHFYASFGFEENRGTWQLIHKPTVDALCERVRAVKRGKSPHP